MAHLGHGLWHPSTEIEIGDVGYIQEGEFKLLFNVTDSAQLAKRNCGEALEYDDTFRTEQKGYLKPDTYQSVSTKTASVGGGPGVNAPGGPVVKIEYSFQHGLHEGTVLYLPYSADRLIVQKNQVWPNYMAANFSLWQAYVKKSQLSCNPDSLVLVRGYIKTSQWAIAAWQSESKATGGNLVGGFHSAEGKLGWYFSEVSGMLKNSNYGPDAQRDFSLTPEADSPPAEERIFLSYYKMKFRWYEPWDPKVTEAAAEPDEPPPAEPEGGAAGAVLSGDHKIKTESSMIPDAITDIDVILDYILNHALEANVAIACDGDVEDLFPDDQDRPEKLDEYLEHNLPPIAVTADGVGTLSLEATILSKQRQRRMQQQHQEHNHGLDSKQRTATVVEKVTLPGGKELQWLPVVLTDGAEDGSSIISCAITKDGSRIATATDNYVVNLWDRFTGQLIAPLEGHEDQVLTVAFSPSGERLISGSSDCRAIIWNLANAQPVITLDHQTGGIWCCAYSPDGETIATGSFDETMCLWTTEGELKHSLGQHDAQVTHIAFSPDSKLLASCAENVTFIWNCETGVRQHRLEGHTASIWNMCFSHDGGRVVTCGDDATSRVWSANTGEELVTLQEHGGPVWGVGFSADDQEIASGSYDSTISVCNSFTGENKFTIRERPAQVNDLAYSKSGRYIATGDGEGLVKVWDASSGAFVAEFQGHEDNVKTIQWTPDDRALVSCSGDGTVRVWDFMDLMRML